ncbi:hypothetical protein OBBRIDRAFT_806877 [Obba rivulosa]|uniref:Uncharacterized protein n=1 Tax=Obba rivulosa TaxID=1052685 RepID=A0A8E2AN37_9APHY|nr:hypothetical protein OBBRIDRAFT_806877 [Obba rivulosa]
MQCPCLAAQLADVGLQSSCQLRGEVKWHSLECGVFGIVFCVEVGGRAKEGLGKHWRAAHHDRRCAVKELGTEGVQGINEPKKCRLRARMAVVGWRARCAGVGAAQASAAANCLVWPYRLRLASGTGISAARGNTQIYVQFGTTVISALKESKAHMAMQAINIGECCLEDVERKDEFAIFGRTSINPSFFKLSWVSESSYLSHNIASKRVIFIGSACGGIRTTMGEREKIRLVITISGGWVYWTGWGLRGRIDHDRRVELYQGGLSWRETFSACLGRAGGSRLRWGSLAHAGGSIVFSTLMDKPW